MRVSVSLVVGKRTRPEQTCSLQFIRTAIATARAVLEIEHALYILSSFTSIQGTSAQERRAQAEQLCGPGVRRIGQPKLPTEKPASFLTVVPNGPA